MENLVTQAEFARNNGWSRSYVTKLKHDGRLVMQQHGRRDCVLVKESLELIAQTADANRDDVKQRWQQHRDDPEQKASQAAHEQEEEQADKATMSYQVARALKETYAARQAKIEYEERIKLLVKAEDVRRAFTAQWTQLRISMDHARDQMAADLAAESDSNVIHAMLGEHFEQLQAEVCRGLSEWSDKEKTQA